MIISDVRLPDGTLRDFAGVSELEDYLSKLQSSQQEEMARLRKAFAIRHFHDIVGVREAASAAHLAEQAKAQEALDEAATRLKRQQWHHEKEMKEANDAGHREGYRAAEHFAIKHEEDALKVAEQTSLASQAKLIRKCAEDAEGVKYNWPVLGAGRDVVDIACEMAFKHVMTNITPAMLQAMEAALAAEKALEGDPE